MSLNYQEVINAFNELLDASPPLTLETVVVDLNVESLEFYAAMLEIEEMFQIEFNLQRLDENMSNVTMKQILDNSVEFSKYKI